MLGLFALRATIWLPAAPHPRPATSGRHPFGAERIIPRAVRVFLVDLLSSIRFSIPKSMIAITPSSPTRAHAANARVQVRKQPRSPHPGGARLYADTDIDLEITRQGDVIAIFPACNSLKQAVAALRRMRKPQDFEKREPIEVRERHE